MHDIHPGAGKRQRPEHQELARGFAHGRNYVGKNVVRDMIVARDLTHRYGWHGRFLTVAIATSLATLAGRHAGRASHARMPVGQQTHHRSTMIQRWSYGLRMNALDVVNLEKRVHGELPITFQLI